MPSMWIRLRATLDVTTGLEAGREVNLEKSLRLADRIDGHLVYGHVDGVGRVEAFDDLGWQHAPGSSRRPTRGREGTSRRKASVTVDGVSLTVNASGGATRPSR